jgi:hypothetical protein
MFVTVVMSRRIWATNELAGRPLNSLERGSIFEVGLELRAFSS